MCAKLKVLFFLFLWLCLSAGVIQPQEEPESMHGKTQPLLLSSGQRLSSSETTLSVWENINTRFQIELTGLQNDLLAALKEAETSRTYSEKSTALLGTSLMKIENLERYNLQIAERMQERDEELAAAYEREDELKKIILKKDNLILKMGIAIGVLLLIIITFIIIKIFFKR